MRAYFDSSALIKRSLQEAESDALEAAIDRYAHRVAALVKRWILSTHQGSVGRDHLPLYLAEFEFRFNRRRSGSRGLVFYRLMKAIIDREPVRYNDLAFHPLPVSKKATRTAPKPPAHPGTPGTPSVEMPR